MTSKPYLIRTASDNEGFTMVVVAALFIAFAVVASVAVERNTATAFITKRDATAVQLSRLSNAIIEYSLFNSSGTTLLYPCPALETGLTTDTTFGAAVTTGCATPATDASGKTSGGIPVLATNVIRGMVPVQTLAQYGIGINDAFDPWNNKIEFVVNRNLTVGSTTFSGAQTSNPTINYPLIPTLSPQPPDFILISYGRDGAGAYRRGQTTISIACPGTGIRGINCSSTTTFTTGPTYTASTATSLTYYDDIVSYYRQ